MKEFEMAVKCGYCKKTGQDMAHVKACAAGAAKTLPEITAPVKAEPFIPAHRKAKMQLAAAQAAIPFNPAGAAQTVQVVAVAQSIDTGTAASLVVPAPVVKTGQELELGMYQVKHENGAVDIYKVKFNKAGTYKFAEKLVISQKSFYNKETSTWDVKPSGKFYYAPSMMAKLTSDNKMSEADAKAFHDMTKAKYGQDYGFCCVCGKLLTNKNSIAKGIGPICGKGL